MKWTIAKGAVVLSLLSAGGATLVDASTAGATPGVTNVTSIEPLGTPVTQGQWAITQDDGSAGAQLNSTVNDPVNHDGSLQLSTTSSTADAVLAQTAISGSPAILSNLSYQTFLGTTPSALSTSGNVSLQVQVACDATNASLGSTTLVFQPSNNPNYQHQSTGEWQTWPDLTTSGAWWSSSLFATTADGGLLSPTSVASGDPGGPTDVEPYLTLMNDLATACPNATLSAIGVGLLADSPSITAWTDNLSYNEGTDAEDWDFQSTVSPAPGIATNVTSIAPVGTAPAAGQWAFTEDDGVAVDQLSSTVNDPINQDGSLRLATTESALDAIVAQTPVTGSPGDLGSLSYQTFLGSTPNTPGTVATSANVSIQASVVCDASNPSLGSTSLIFEPNQNAGLTTQVIGAWQSWSNLTDTGVWSSSSFFSTTLGGGLFTPANAGPSDPGGPTDVESYQSLVGELTRSCPNATLTAIGFGLGPNTPSVSAWVDNLMYTVPSGAEHWNFVGSKTVPSAPTIKQVEPGDGDALVAFNTPSSGGVAIESYTVTAIDLTNAANGGQTATAAASPILVGGLTDGNTYDFTVTATNQTGTSDPSAPSNSVIPNSSLSTTPTLPPAPVAATPGYDLVGSDGGVFTFGQSGAGFYGSLPGLDVSVNDIVGMAPTKDGGGYLLVGSDGGVFAFGDAKYRGSLPTRHKHANDIVGIVPTPDGKGYFLVGADGGVFAYGDAAFEQSLPGLGIHVNDIVGIAPTPDNQGYWLVASSGHVYALGDAQNYGSASAGPIVSITSTADGGGYWLTSANGGVDNYGDAGFYQSLPAIGVGVSDIVSLVPSPDGAGYLLLGSDGGIFAFGDATYPGSLPGEGVHVNNIVGAVPVA
jgi:hypothetical protein